ncbi:MAG: mechanosensitive ion channel family protein [Candidatus Paceibacterales bacterium]
MADELLIKIGIDVTNPWIEAGLNIGLYVILYFTARALWRVAKIKITARLAPLSNAHAKIDLFLVFYKLVKRILQVSLFYYVTSSIPFLTKYDLIIHSICFVFGILLTISTTFKLTDHALYFIFNGNARDMTPLISRVIKILFFLIGLMVGMRHFNYDIWHIVTALGIGSLAVGLAAQPTLTNIIAGFNLLIDRPFQIGDRVKLGTGEVGDVIHIGLRCTRIKTTDGNTLVAPNSELVNSRIVNYSEPDNMVANSVKFQFDRDCDFITIKKILTGALTKVEGASDPADVFLNAATDGTIEFNISFKAKDYSQLPHVTDKIIHESLEVLRKNKIPLAESRLKSALKS